MGEVSASFRVNRSMGVLVEALSWPTMVGWGGDGGGGRAGGCGCSVRHGGPGGCVHVSVQGEIPCNGVVGKWEGGIDRRVLCNRVGEMGRDKKNKERVRHDNRHRC